jgi:hypothetical protein
LIDVNVLVLHQFFLKESEQAFKTTKAQKVLKVINNP